jgi:bifunctional DNA-binding transcriptional regulator/antitoxin component of YhaV-PrlF toxin-antitoxin module
MPKNAVKPEEPYSEQTSLGGPIPVVMGTGRMGCRLKISGKILEHSGLKPNDKVVLIAGENEIIIRKIGEPTPGLPFKSSSGTTRMLDSLMDFTREKEAELKEARERMYAYREEPEAEAEGVDGAAPLNLEQVSEEEL